MDEPACRCEELFGISEFLARPLQPKFPSVQLGPVRWTIFHLGPLVRNLFRSVPIERNKARPFQRPFCQRTTGLFPADSAQPRSTWPSFKRHVLFSPPIISHGWLTEAHRRQKKAGKIAPGASWSVKCHISQDARGLFLRSNMAFWSVFHTGKYSCPSSHLTVVNRDFEPSAASVGEYQYLNAWKRLIVYRKSFYLTCTLRLSI